MNLEYDDKNYRTMNEVRRNDSQIAVMQIGKKNLFNTNLTTQQILKNLTPGINS